MDQELQDLLALWMGDLDPGESRRAALFTRLRDDETFRQAFVDEISLLGMLKATQSSEPRWLRLEDEIGWSASSRGDVETLTRTVLDEGGRRLRRSRLVRWCATAALAALAVTVLFGIFRRQNTVPGVPAESPRDGITIATAIKVDDVHWESGSGATPDEGSVVTPGRLRLRSGRLTLAFFNGASLSIEGPADLDLLAADRVFCRRGKLRARVPHGAEGFTVLGPGYEVVDLGTEFALNLDQAGGKSMVMVFEGEAAVSVVGNDGRSVRGALLERQRAVEVDPDAGRIQDVSPKQEVFIPLPQFVPAPLELAAGYAAEVIGARPWGYWRFAALDGDRVRNEITGRPALKALGGIRLEESRGRSHWARFRPNDHTQAFLMDGTWIPPREAGYAIEMWVQADLPSPNAFGQTALVGLIDPEGGQEERHLAYLELTARGRRSAHEPCAVRFLERWPAAVSGGADLFSRRTVVPSLWHHVVGQKRDVKLELFVDGVRVGTSPVKTAGEDADDRTGPCRLLVGRLKEQSGPPYFNEIRAFEGRIGELAVYDHPLTSEEIRRHAGFRVASGTP
jgi:hypothetical protein